MLTAVLTRFKEQLQAGTYDDTRHIKPLLTEPEHPYIERQKAIEEKRQERQWQKDRNIKTKKASALIKKYQDNEDAKALLAAYYGDNIMVLSQFGNIGFSPAGKIVACWINALFSQRPLWELFSWKK